MTITQENLKKDSWSKIRPNTCWAANIKSSKAWRKRPEKRKKPETTQTNSNRIPLILNIFLPRKIYENYSKSNQWQLSRVINYLKEIIGGIRIQNGKVKKFNISCKMRKCILFFFGARNLCCDQVITTTTFISQQW